MTIVGITGKPIPPEVSRLLRLYAMTTFLIVALFCISTAYWQARQTDGLRHAQRAAYDNCQAIVGTVQQSRDNVVASKTITDEQRARSLATYKVLLAKLDCSGLKP